MSFPEEQMTDTEERAMPLIYTIGLVSFILCFMEIELSWSYPASPFKYLSFASLTLHLLNWIQQYSGRQLLMLAFAFIIVVIVGHNAQQMSLLYLSFALVVGAKGIDYEQILKVCFITGFSICLISVIGSWLGIIENKVFHLSADSMVMMGASSSVRYSYGYGWPTGCGIHISYVCLTYWLLRKGLLNWKELSFILFAFWFTFSINKSRQASLIILLMILFSLYLKYCDWRQRVPSKLFLKSLIIAIPLFAILSMYASIAYDDGDISWVALNLIFSTRLSLGQDAIEQYGIPWLGQYVLMVGGDANSFDYNYVDSSYVQAYLLWGIVLTTALVVFFCMMCVSAYKRRDVAFLLAVLFAGLSSISSQYLFQIMHCPLLLALFARHINSIDTNENLQDYDEEGRIETANIETNS